MLALLLLGQGPGEVFGIVLFPSGEEAEQITVGAGAEHFRAVAIVMQAFLREDIWPLPLQTVKGGQGNAKAPVEMTQGFKQLGFLLRVFLLLFRAAARGFGVPGTRGFRVLAWKPGFGLPGTKSSGARALKNEALALLSTFLTTSPQKLLTNSNVSLTLS